MSNFIAENKSILLFCVTGNKRRELNILTSTSKKQTMKRRKGDTYIIYVIFFIIYLYYFFVVYKHCRCDVHIRNCHTAAPVISIFNK